ncbi:hypothetical protein [Oceanithermus sp.]
MLGGNEGVLRLEPGPKIRRFYLLSLFVAVVFIALAVWLYFNYSRWLAALVFLVFLDMLLALPRSWSWAQPLEVRGEQLCRNGDCRHLASLTAAGFNTRNAARVANMSEGALELKWEDGEVWHVPLSLCGWDVLWERIRELLPGLELGDWRQDTTLQQILARAWDMPICLPQGVVFGSLQRSNFTHFILLMLLLGLIDGLVVGLLEIFFPGYGFGWVGGLLAMLVAVWYLGRRRRGG